MSKNIYVVVLYFVELCTYIIPDVSNNVQTQKSVPLFRTTMLFVLWPFSNF